MKRYKLKKDLPTFKAGSGFYLSDSGSLIYDGDDVGIVAYSKKTLEKFPNILKDWFEEIPEEYKRWRAKKGEKFWTIWCNGKSTDFTDRREGANDELYSIGNYFKTEKETSKRIEYLIALQTIKDDAKGFVPDWGNLGQRKYYGFYDHIEKSLEWSSNRNFQNQGCIYFKTKEDLEESFKKHRKEWLTVLGIENETNETNERG